MCYSYPQILYVDRDIDACEMVRLVLDNADDNYQVTAISLKSEASEIISNRSFDLYIFDNPWNEPSGLELCRLVRQTYKKTPVMVFSVLDQEGDRNDAREAGATAYLVKPEDMIRFVDTVKILLTRN